MLDEMTLQNTSFAVFFEYENTHVFFPVFHFVLFYDFLMNKLARNEKKTVGFSYSKNMANFEAVH